MKYTAGGGDCASDGLESMCIDLSQTGQTR